LKNSCDNRQIHQIKINTHNFYLVGQCTFSPTPYCRTPVMMDNSPKQPLKTLWQWEFTKPKTTIPVMTELHQN
jgi:hypothetical protein